MSAGRLLGWAAALVVWATLGFAVVRGSLESADTWAERLDDPSQRHVTSALLYFARNPWSAQPAHLGALDRAVRRAIAHPDAERREAGLSAASSLADKLPDALGLAGLARPSLNH